MGQLPKKVKDGSLKNLQKVLDKKFVPYMLKLESQKILNSKQKTMKTKNTLTVESLRKSGALVRVIHSRRVGPSKSALNKLKDWLTPVVTHVAKGNFNNLSDQVLDNFRIPQVVLQRGGLTEIVVDTKDGKHYVGRAICNNKDAYNKRRGVRIALAEIYRDMKVNGEVI